MRLPLFTASLCLIAAPQAAFAQDDYEDWGDGPPGKFAFSLIVAATESEVVLTDSEVTLPEDADLGDFEVTLAEDVKVSNTFVGASVGYRVFEFLEINAQAGFISTSSDLGLSINGTPSDTFPITFDEPISLQSEVSTSADGYSLGVGATGFLPVATIGESALVGYASYQHIWNEFSDEGISVDIGRVSTGLLFPVSPQSEGKPIFRIGTTYVDTSRTLERGAQFGGEEILVRATQETEDPWFGEVGIAFPASRRVLLNAGVSVQTTGDVSVLGTITFRP
ncbi:MAG: hypothetical protein AAFQ90_09590 [Pseudomonadota bacterium]